MLRILDNTDALGTTLYLQGKLLAPWTSEVRIAAASALARGPVRLDLADLSYADRDGIAALQSLRHAGVELVRVSAFIDNLLARAGGDA
jgi:hypothetical protein